MGTYKLISLSQKNDLFLVNGENASFWIEKMRYLLTRTKYFCEFHGFKKVAYKNKFQISELQIELLMWLMSNSDLKQHLKLLLWRSATELNETSFGSTPLETSHATATNSRNS